jgi:deoxycytidine triphosphate deaminase
VILSDVSIKAALADGRIIIDPLDERSIQPSSVDLHVDRYFRVFRNDTTPFIDPKEPQENLTELVEVSEEGAFILHPGEFVLGSTYERVALPDDLVARLEGKALALDTEVPTPSGWRTMGDLAVGDLVFDETGTPCTVVGATPVLDGRPCRDVIFSDGTVVTCDVLHQWVTTTKNERRYGRRRFSVRTTHELEASLTVRGERNHQVALAGPADFPPADLPIDPYVFGIWIGDGTSTKAEVIPEPYLIGSVAQRQALLEGLMDSDGYCDKWGRCEFTTIREPLAEQVRELVASLGFRPVIAKKPAMLNGIDHGPKYDVTFTPDRPVFRLTRKLRRQKEQGRRFHRCRAVASVSERPSVPVRCIEVSAPSGQFLVTRSYIPTHNSSLGRLGLLIHSTAGFVDAGWDGHLTLELSNVANLPIAIYPGMKIGQISFLEMTTPAAEPYGSKSMGSKYQGQRGPTPSRYYLNFEQPDGA